jgi:hypothetical protein
MDQHSGGSSAGGEPSNGDSRRRGRDPEFWIAIGALLVSALAMLTSLLQTGIQRNQERAMVWPHVSAGSRYSGEGYSFVAANKGLGPALVRSVRLRVDGEVSADWSQVLDQVLGEAHGYGWEVIQVNDLADTILAAAESRVMFAIPWDERTRAAFDGKQRIEAEICYCSFLDECWISTSGLDHTRVEDCPRSPAATR